MGYAGAGCRPTLCAICTDVAEVETTSGRYAEQTLKIKEPSLWGGFFLSIDSVWDSSRLVFSLYTDSLYTAKTDSPYRFRALLHIYGYPVKGFASMVSLYTDHMNTLPIYAATRPIPISR